MTSNEQSARSDGGSVRERCECGSDEFNLHSMDEWDDDNPAVILFCARCGTAIGRFVRNMDKPVEVA